MLFLSQHCPEICWTAVCVETNWLKRSSGKWTGCNNLLKPFQALHHSSFLNKQSLISWQGSKTWKAGIFCPVSYDRSAPFSQNSEITEQTIPPPTPCEVVLYILTWKQWEIGATLIGLFTYRQSQPAADRHKSPKHFSQLLSKLLTPAPLTPMLIPISHRWFTEFPSQSVSSPEGQSVLIKYFPRRKSSPSICCCLNRWKQTVNRIQLEMLCS